MQYRRQPARARRDGCEGITETSFQPDSYGNRASRGHEQISARSIARKSASQNARPTGRSCSASIFANFAKRMITNCATVLLTALSQNKLKGEALPVSQVSPGVPIVIRSVCLGRLRCRRRARRHVRHLRRVRAPSCASRRCPIPAQRPTHGKSRGFRRLSSL